jgi:uncharacterized membrane protein
VSRERAYGAVVALCVVTLLVGWWTKGRCLGDGTWNGGEEWTGWCYTDVFPLWFAERLSEGATPYVDHPVEYPVLIGAQMWVTQQLVEVVDGGAVAFYHLTALLGAPLLLWTLFLLHDQGVPPSRLAWFAVAPTLAIYAFLNWDPLAVLLFVAAIAAHRRGADGWAGVWAGLGTAAKLFPAVLVPLVVLARLGQGRWRDALRHVGAALATWLVVNLPVLVAAPQGWGRFWQLNRERPANFDSLWYLAEQLRGAPFDRSLINAASAVVLLAAGVAIVAVGRRVYPPAEYWRLALPALCAFLLVNKVYSPQYSLWILPLLPLVLPRLAPFAAFAVADLLVWVVEFPFLGGVVDAVEQAPGYEVVAFAVVVRALALVWILVESLRPTLATVPPVAPASPAARREPLRSALDLA